MTLYDDLGVPKTADTPTIKKAYRRKAQKAHPDKGGDKAKFYAIQRAYDVLGDEMRRKKYDETGDESDPQPVELQAMGILASLLLQLVEKIDVEHQNLIDIARQEIANNISNIKREVNNVKESIKKREKAIKRISTKDEKNIVRQILQNNIADHNRHLYDMQNQIETLQACEVLLNGYSYKADPSMQRGPSISSMSIFEAMSRQAGWQTRKY
jgi:curved DNA-binding protein CbpA